MFCIHDWTMWEYVRRKILVHSSCHLDMEVREQEVWWKQRECMKCGKRAGRVAGQGEWHKPIGIAALDKEGEE